MENSETFTLLAKCQECGLELFRAEGVTLEGRHDVIMSIPDKAICTVNDHNTFPEVPQNYGADVECFREKKTRKGKITGLVSVPLRGTP